MILYLTVLPAIIIFLYFYFSQEFKTIHSLIFQVFVIGLFIAFPAGTLNTFIIKNFSNQNPVNNALLMGFFAGGLVEELLKFSVLYFFVLEHNKIVRPKYILVFGMIVSLGFAIHENYTYVFGNKDKAFQLYVSLVRIYSAVPMHIFNGVIMGCFFAFYKHSKDIKFLGYSILIPIILHGSYNFLLGVDFLHIEKIIVIIMIFLSYKFFKIVERLDSKYK
jgi:hypothetical protein